MLCCTLDDEMTHSEVLCLNDMVPDPRHICSPVQKPLHREARPIDWIPVTLGGDAIAKRYVHDTCNIKVVAFMMAAHALKALRQKKTAHKSMVEGMITHNSARSIAICRQLNRLAIFAERYSESYLSLIVILRQREQ